MDYVEEKRQEIRDYLGEIERISEIEAGRAKKVLFCGEKKPLEEITDLTTLGIYAGHAWMLMCAFFRHQQEIV